MGIVCHAFEIGAKARPMETEELFRTAFWAHYPRDAREDLAASRARDASPDAHPVVAARMETFAETFAQGVAALAPELPPLTLDDAGVHHLSRIVGPKLRDELLARGELTAFVAHGVAWLGEVIVRGHGGVWRFRNPLWESLVHLSSSAGEADLPLFGWFLRALTADADGLTSSSLADRYRRFVERPKLDAAALPRFLARDGQPPRKLPRLSKVRYAALHAYLRAHLPELADLGPNFPSPERFEAYAFAFLDVTILGDGRMALLSGLATGGFGAFWLGAAGFEAAMFIPCDSFPEPRAEATGTGDLLAQRVRVHFAREGTTHTEELLWWGP